MNKERRLNELFQKAWGQAKVSPEYDKSVWVELDGLIWDQAKQDTPAFDHDGVLKLAYTPDPEAPVSISNVYGPCLCVDRENSMAAMRRYCESCYDKSKPRTHHEYELKTISSLGLPDKMRDALAIPRTRCSCGVDSVGGGIHSDYCHSLVDSA